MWRHGIHAFLEVLWFRPSLGITRLHDFVDLPCVPDDGLLFATVIFSQDTWIECLRDFARYRMATGVEKEACFIRALAGKPS